VRERCGKYEEEGEGVMRVACVVGRSRSFPVEAIDGLTSFDLGVGTEGSDGTTNEEGSSRSWKRGIWA